MPDVWFLQQIADQPRADHPDIVDARREIRILHRGERLADLLDLQLDRAFGIDPSFGDAPVHAADQARIRQHREVGVEHRADLVGRRSRQRHGPRLQLAQLFDRDRDRIGKAASLRFDLRFVEPAFVDRQFAAIADIGGADGDPGGDADAL